MPLNKPSNYDARELPYELKVQLVEENCTGCPFFLFDFSSIEPIYGCSYPPDTKDLNHFTREPYLTMEEIIHNTCDFWRGRIPFERITIDNTPGVWEEIDGGSLATDKAIYGKN